MAALPEGITQQDLDRYAHLSAGILALKEEYEALNAQIKKAFTEAGYTGKHTLVYGSPRYGSVVVVLGEQKKVDTEALVAAFPYDRFPEYWQEKISQDAIPATRLNDYRTNIVMTLSVKGENPLPDLPGAALVGSGTSTPRRLMQR